jgi:hypothetical protein
MKNTKGDIADFLRAQGPSTGLEITKGLNGDSLIIWRTCKLSKEFAIATVGDTYLRLDRRVDGFSRLSPSILRQFLTYSVIGLASDPVSLEQRAAETLTHVREISRQKFDLARQMVCGLAERLEDQWPRDHDICFIIGGDIVYGMAHDVPRPERSTGKLVRGSDIDLVIVVDDEMPDSFIKTLDENIYQEKYKMLITPSCNEEVDYIIKKLERVREQIKFDTFKHMVACKILQEGQCLYGSEALFRTLKAMLQDLGVTQRLRELEESAAIFRKNAEESLLYETPEKIKADGMYLFYSAEELEEFE